MKLSVVLTDPISLTFDTSFLPKSRSIKCSDFSFGSFNKSFSYLLSSIIFFPLGLVPAIGLIVTLFFETFTNISGLAPTI